MDETYLVALKEDFIRFANRLPLQLLNHLVTEYGTASSLDLLKNQAKMSEPWNPDLLFTDFWAKIRRIRNLATTAGKPILDGTTIELACKALLGAGVYGHSITL